MVGSDLQMVLQKTTLITVQTAHVGLVPSSAAAAGLGSIWQLLNGAPGLPDVLPAPGKFLHLIINVTNANGGTLVVTIGGFDPQGNFYTILVSAAIVANGVTVLRVGPGLTAAANTVANDFIPISWNLSVSVTVANMTFGLTALFMP